MKTVTVETKAWITGYSSLTPADLENGRVAGLIYTDADMKSDGWTLVGTATITVSLVDKDTLIQNKVAALREEAKAIRADATEKVTRIEGQIQNLLAISYTATEAAA